MLVFTPITLWFTSSQLGRCCKMIMDDSLGPAVMGNRLSIMVPQKGQRRPMRPSHSILTLSPPDGSKETKLKFSTLVLITSPCVRPHPVLSYSSNHKCTHAFIAHET